MLIICAYLIHRKNVIPNFSSMDGAFMEEFHRKRQECGIVYASGDWLTLLLEHEFNIRATGGVFSLVSEKDIISGPFIIRQMNQTAYIIRTILRQVAYGITISLGLENGPVICWSCQALESDSIRELKRIKAVVREGGRYD